MEIKENVKLFAKASGLLLAKMVTTTLIGVVINWIFLAVSIVPFIYVFGVDVGAAGRNPIGAIIGLIVNIHVVLYFFGFLLVMPYLYLLAGKSMGLQRAFSLIYDKKKELFYTKVASACIDIYDKIKDSISQEKISAMVLKALEAREKLPAPMKIIFENFIKKIPFDEIINTDKVQEELSTGNREKAISHIIVEIDNRVTKDFFKGKTKKLTRLIMRNLLVFGVIIVVLLIAFVIKKIL